MNKQECGSIKTSNSNNIKKMFIHELHFHIIYHTSNTEVKFSTVFETEIIVIIKSSLCGNIYARESVNQRHDSPYPIGVRNVPVLF